MRFSPFQALLPPPAIAHDLACVPYDTVDTVEARRLAAGNPRSFLHVTRAEIDLPADTDPHSGGVYDQAAAAFARFQQEGLLRRDADTAFYVYRIRKGVHVQDGVVGCCHFADYAANVIKRHEKTRVDKENDRLRHILALRTHSGPVYLTYRDRPEIDSLVAGAVRGEPLLTARGEDGSIHEIWPVVKQAGVLQAAFAQVSVCYIADGHHRAAASVRAAETMREANPAHRGDEAYNQFLSVMFPASQLRIMPYNRCVRDLNGLTADAFLHRVRESFAVTADVSPSPDGPRRVSMYLAGRWYGLAWAETPDADPVSNLDVSILQDRLLSPLLGIDDPRTSPRIEFVGGVRGTGDLVRRVEAGDAAVAFSMFPVTVGDMIRIADADCIMPPKSTWFEPKLRSGLVVHTF